MNVLTSLKQYAGKWSIKSKRAFTEEEINSVEKAEVVSSDYGNSVCFHLVGGGMTFIPLSVESELTPGESVNLRSAELLVLEKSGENDILRVNA